MNSGYRILQIHEILPWKETEMYDPSTKKGDLFTYYINTFLRLTQQSSGYPNHVQTEEQMDEYIRKYSQHEEIL